MIKLFAWEDKILDQIDAKRARELRLIRDGKLLGNVTYFVNTILPLVSKVFTFGLFTLVMKRELTASVLFPAMAVFRLVERSLWMVMYWAPQAIRAKVRTTIL